MLVCWYVLVYNCWYVLYVQYSVNCTNTRE